MRVLIVFLFTLTVTACGAQVDYGFEEAFIMTKLGDSIKGFVEVAPSYGAKIGYKKTLQDVETFIPTKDIKFILTPNRSLENIDLGKRELLMTMVADGKARLYLQVVSRAARYGNTAYYESREMVFVIKKGPVYLEVTRKRFREILSALMYDCPEVVKRLREEVYVYEEMHKAVTYYNTCK